MKAWIGWSSRPIGVQGARLPLLLMPAGPLERSSVGGEEGGVGTGEAQAGRDPGRQACQSPSCSLPPPSTRSAWGRTPAAAWRAWWTPAWACG